MLQTSICARTPAGNSPGWTGTRTERLKQLWAEGHSASEIAALLGWVTRNAVIGKVHRLGLAGRKTTSRQSVRRTSPRRHGSGRAGLREAPARFVRPASPLPPAPPPPVAALMLPLRQLRADQCRWPIGDPKEACFGFCGCQKAPGAPYCGHHAAIAYNPAASRWRSAWPVPSGSRTLWRRHWGPGASPYHHRRAFGRVPGGIELRALRPPAFADGHRRGARRPSSR